MTGFWVHQNDLEAEPPANDDCDRELYIAVVLAEDVASAAAGEGSSVIRCPSCGTVRYRPSPAGEGHAREGLSREEIEALLKHLPVVAALPADDAFYGALRDKLRGWLASPAPTEAERLAAVLMDVESAVAALPEEEQRAYRESVQSVIDARRGASPAPEGDE